MQGDLSAKRGPTSDEAGELAHARRRGKRLVVAALVVVATGFIAMSAFQIIGAVFGPPPAPIAATETGASRECISGLRTLRAALDRSVKLTSAAEDELGRSPPEPLTAGSALERFAENLSPEWDRAAEIEALCGKTQGGRDATAALFRLRRAEERLMGRRAVEVAPLRRDVAAYLPR